MAGRTLKVTLRREDYKNSLIARINRIKGQMEGVKRMVEDSRYCADILIQLSAIDKSVKSLAAVILDNHLHTCVVNDIKKDDNSSLDEISELFKRFV